MASPASLSLPGGFPAPLAVPRLFNLCLLSRNSLATKTECWGGMPCWNASLVLHGSLSAHKQTPVKKLSSRVGFPRIPGLQ